MNEPTEARLEELEETAEYRREIGTGYFEVDCDELDALIAAARRAERLEEAIKRIDSTEGRAYDDGRTVISIERDGTPNGWQIVRLDRQESSRWSCLDLRSPCEPTPGAQWAALVLEEVDRQALQGEASDFPKIKKRKDRRHETA